MSTGRESGVGVAYIYNMCDEPVTLRLNSSLEARQIPAFEVNSENLERPCQMHFTVASRSSDPRPYQRFEIGGSETSSGNTVAYFLSDNVSETRIAKVSIILGSLHLEQDLQIFLFYKSIVVRQQGISQRIDAQITEPDN